MPGIILGSSFDRTSAVPLDSRFSVADIAARDAIASGVRFQGMTVFVISDTKTYQLKTGITNADWVEYGGGAAIIINRDVFSGNGAAVAFTLTADPGSIDNTFVYIHGVFQQKATYSVATTTLTFTTAPPIGTGNIEVVYGPPINSGVPSDNTVSTVKIQGGAITQAKKEIRAVVTSPTAAAAGQVVKSASSGTFFSSSATYVDVTDLTVTITTLGNPVRLELQSDGTANLSFVQASSSANTARSAFKFLRGATSLGEVRLDAGFTGTTTANVTSPPNVVSYLDVVAAGTYTYKLQTYNVTAGTTSVYYSNLIAYEI